MENEQTHVREIPARVASPLAGCRVEQRAKCGARFEIRPIRFPYIALQPLQMVAGHLNVPTLWLIPLENIEMLW